MLPSFVFVNIRNFACIFNKNQSSMTTKKLLGILILFLCTFNLTGCKNDDEGRKVMSYRECVLTVASKKIPGVLTSSGYHVLTDVFVAKEYPFNDWVFLGAIKGFDYEPGYEYTIKISETSYLDYNMGEPAWTERELLEVIAKEERASDNLPLHLIPAWYYKDQYTPEYNYIVEADSKALIEEDLKSSPILPLDYHYLLYRSDHPFLSWIAIKDDTHVLGSGTVKSLNRNPSEMPESYRLLPPEYKDINMEWTFLDESGNELNGASFDVALGYSYKSREAAPPPNLVYLYQDLTEHYKAKYPDAGVTAVAVSYAISIKM